MNKPEFKIAEVGQRPFASEHNKITRLVSGLCNSLHIQGFCDSTGFHTRRTPIVSVPHTLFRVVSEAVGDGVYNCYEQILDSTKWLNTAGDNKFNDLDAVPIEVLNLAEFDPEATYVSHLVADDLITAWKETDSKSITRWAGLPLRKANADRPRIAWCKDDAGAGATIDCYLDADNIGTEITVSCSIAGLGINLNEAVPRLEISDKIFVTKVGATWWCLTTFMKSEDCDCVEA